MSFVCPKCDSHADINPDEVKDSGSFQTCNVCKKKFWVQRESHVLRPFKKDGRVYCASCSDLLPAKNICLSCGNLYPDYVLVQISKPAARKAEKTSFFISSGSRKKMQASGCSGVKPAFNRSLAVKLAIGILMAGSLGVAGNVYFQNKHKAAFFRNYTVALYGVKAGMDMGVSKCGASTQDNAAFSLTDSEINDLKLVSSELDKLALDLAAPPADFLFLNDQLTAIRGTYNKVVALNLNYSGSLNKFCEQAKPLEKEFDAKAKALKANMPEGLALEIKNSSLKYKNLQFML